MYKTSSSPHGVLVYRFVNSTPILENFHRKQPLIFFAISIDTQFGTIFPRQLISLIRHTVCAASCKAIARRNGMYVTRRVCRSNITRFRYRCHRGFDNCCQIGGNVFLVDTRYKVHARNVVARQRYHFYQFVR